MEKSYTIIYVASIEEDLEDLIQTFGKVINFKEGRKLFFSIISNLGFYFGDFNFILQFFNDNGYLLESIIYNDIMGIGLNEIKESFSKNYILHNSVIRSDNIRNYKKFRESYNYNIYEFQDEYIDMYNYKSYTLLSHIITNLSVKTQASLLMKFILDDMKLAEKIFTKKLFRKRDNYGNTILHYISNKIVENLKSNVIDEDIVVSFFRKFSSKYGNINVANDRYVRVKDILPFYILSQVEKETKKDNEERNKILEINNCKDNLDPISLEKISNLHLDLLRNLIILEEGVNKTRYCYNPESIYYWIFKTNVPTSPISKRKLTNNEILDIYKKYNNIKRKQLSTV